MFIKNLHFYENKLCSYFYSLNYHITPNVVLFYRIFIESPPLQSQEAKM